MQSKTLVFKVTLVALLVSSKATYAQTDISYSVAQIEKELGNTQLLLTRSQEEKISVINRQFEEKKQLISSDKRLSFTEFNQKIHQLQIEKEVQLRAILNKEQYDLYIDKKS